MSSAWRNQFDLERYLADLLKQLLNGCCDYESLLPHVWLAVHPDAVREYREDERRDVEERQRERRDA